MYISSTGSADTYLSVSCATLYIDFNLTRKEKKIPPWHVTEQPCYEMKYIYSLLAWQTTPPLRACIQGNNLTFYQLMKVSAPACSYIVTRVSRKVCRSLYAPKFPFDFHIVQRQTPRKVPSNQIGYI